MAKNNGTIFGDCLFVDSGVDGVCVCVFVCMYPNASSPLWNGLFKTLVLGTWVCDYETIALDTAYTKEALLVLHY